MILNHKSAIEFLVDAAEDIGFNRYTILNLHAVLADNLLPEPDAPGRLRRFGVAFTVPSFIRWKRHSLSKSVSTGFSPRQTL